MQKNRIEAEKDMLERESRSRRASLDAELEDVESRSSSSCKPNKVITHDCTSGGYHKVEYITYEYNHGTCKKHVKVEKEPCSSSAGQVDSSTQADDADTDDTSTVQQSSENMGSKDSSSAPEEKAVHEIEKKGTEHDKKVHQ